MDPLSLSASIIAILTLSATVVQYLIDVKAATGDRQTVLQEIVYTTGLLTLIKDHTEKAEWGETWPVIVKWLATPNGPLEQFKRALERLMQKLQPASGVKKAVKGLIWSFQKEEIKNILKTIERQKTFLTLALQNDYM